MMKLTRPFHGIILILFVMLAINSTSATTKYNVLSFGAKPNGKTDSTKAFLMAWEAACSSADSTMIYVPKGRYLLGSMAFKGGSIGSLAKDLKEEGVQNVTIRKTTFMETQNGLRIKSWARPSTGFVQGVRFLDSLMRNVQNPIVIDQNYCPHNLNCPNQVSGIKIKDIIYEGIRGTSSTQVAIKFDCSPKNPCTGIRLQNVNLSYLNKPAQSSCSNVRGKALNLVRPESCL
ncbi:hypothetical protein V6Z11_D13G003700 [Gossypium hirsutum]|uniref:Polygalacturonase-like n=1 Tax=Gossypium hirsutum TaxID=3635 RepID=A0A1U8M9U0_GOSHI|nr:polygalacturonase-like [Gossypium hirsutum]